MSTNEFDSYLRSRIPDVIVDEAREELEDRVKQISGNTKRALDLADMQRLKQLLEFQEKNKNTSGFQKWYVPGTPFGIDKLPKHEAFFGSTREHRETLMLGGNRCLAQGTLVATSSGPRTIESIREGDCVYDCYGNPTKVIATWDNGEADVIHLSNRGKEWLVCTPNHELDCQESRRTARRMKLRADSLLTETQVRRAFPISPLGLVNEPHAYVIGAMLGDGCCTCGNSKKIVISSADDKVPSKIANILGVKCIDNNHNYSWNITCPIFNNYHWMKGKLCHEKEVDLDVVKSWNRTSLLNFVAGLIDTDGNLSVVQNGCSLSLHNQSRSIISAFEYACLALWQEIVSIVVDGRSKYKNGPVYRAYISNPHSIRRIAKELEPNIVHKYKVDWMKLPEGKRSYSDRIALKMTGTSRVRVYDITVEHPEHLYLLSNGLSVSNCGKTRAGAAACAILATGLYPDWWPGVRFNGPVSVWAAGKTGQSTRDTVQEAILGPIGSWGTGALPANTIGRTSARQGIAGAIDTIEVVHVSGAISTIGLKSYDQKPNSFYGTAKHLVWLDEPAPELVYHEMLMRTMMLPTDPIFGPPGGRLIHTITPKEGLTRLLADFLRDCDLLAGATRIKGLEALKVLDDMEATDEY